MQFYIYLAKKQIFFMKVILKRVNIKLWDILGCFHYILNAPRTMAIYTMGGWGVRRFSTIR